MSWTKSETQLETTHLHGNFDMLKSKILLLTLTLLLLLMGTAWGRSCVRSVGSGPSFTVCPVVVIAGPNGHFHFNIISGNPNVEYEVLLNGKKSVSRGRLKKFESELPFGKLYSYLVIKSVGQWESSSATILVLSPKLKKINADKEIFISTIPQVFGYELTESGTLFTVLNAGFGGKSLKVSLDNTTLMATNLSPISNSPQLFETHFNTKKLTNGKHSLKAQLLLITGEKLFATATITVQKYIPRPVVKSLEVSPKEVSPQKITLTVSAVIKDKTGIKSVEINGVAADAKKGKWVALVPVDFSKVKTCASTNVKFTVKATNNFNESTESSSTVKISVKFIPSVPTNLHKTSVTANSISISWNASREASYYKIYRSTDGLNFSQIATTTSTSYSDKELSPSTTYYYKVTSVNDCGESDFSNVISVVTPFIWWWLIGIFTSFIALLLLTIYY